MKPSPDEIKVRPLSERDNLVKHDDFAQVLPPVEGFGDWFRSLPDIYGGTNLKRVVELVVAARKSDKQVGISLGAHLLKCGLSPLLIDLMRRGFVTHVSTNGAGVIHDWEIAYQGETSEDVAAGLPDGSFGFWKETFAALNGAAARAEREQIGYGAALGQTILDEGLPHASLSVWGEARRLGIPATVHVAFGCDIVHMDPALDGAALGNATQRDFWLFADTVGKLDGGIWLNIGSAVIMPEVFLKAVSIARNRGALGTDFATCNFDMMHQYRALTNVVQRPPREGLSVICQHEIILPILHQALLALGSEAGLDMEVR
jgi:hypothetical protein